MYYNEISKRVEKIKDREGGARMREDVFYRMRCEGREEGRALGREEGRKFERLVNARAMLASGIPSRQVADILNLSEKDMKEVIRHK